jgi:hypothetical protein
MNIKNGEKRNEMTKRETQACTQRNKKQLTNKRKNKQRQKENNNYDKKKTYANISTKAVMIALTECWRPWRCKEN